MSEADELTSPPDPLSEFGEGESSASSETPPLKRASYLLHVASIGWFNLSNWKRHDGYDRRLAFERLTFIPLMDEVLGLFETEPRFQHFTCDFQTFLIEDYLSIRPQQFDRIEQFVREGRLLIGPWYIQTDPMLGGIEAIIRNLMIGLRTAQAIGRALKVAYLPFLEYLPGQIPQILTSFGIETVLDSPVPSDGYKTRELLWQGIDGTQVIAGIANRATEDSLISSEKRAKPSSESGHLLILKHHDLESGPITTLFDDMRYARSQFPDQVFHSNPLAYAKAVETFAKSNALPLLKSTEPLTRLNKAEHMLLFQLEPFAAWAEALPTAKPGYFIHKPQLLLQKLWKSFYVNHEQTFLDELWGQIYKLANVYRANIAENVCTTLLSAEDSRALLFFNQTNDAQTVNIHLESWSAGPTNVPPLSYTTFAVPNKILPFFADYLISTESLVITYTDIHDGTLPLSASVIATSSDDFRISAVKLPEESERDGMIVRGYNLTGEDRWVTLTPWRPFAVVEVVTMDEVPTGGKLAAESNGAVQFKAGPHRILTFWFHD